MRHGPRRGHFALVLAGALLLLGACDSVDPNTAYPRKEGSSVDPNPSGDRDTVFGPGGLNFLGKDGPFGRNDGGGGGSGIGVNSFLWRASLDTLSFMPLASADPFGGVIITDWFSPPEAPDERFKMTVYILDRRLRADGLKVAVFRQSRTAPASGWSDAGVAAETAIDLENAILYRARELRVAAIAE